MDAVLGKKVTLPVSYEEPCEHCHGTRAEDPSAIQTCPYCGGRGYVVHNQRTIFGTMQQRETCQHCGGSGKIIKTPCRTCLGQGYKKVKKDLVVNIPAGINSGQQVRVTGKGGRGLNGGPNGDLYIVITVRPHRLFRRDGINLYLDMPISFPTAALGGEIEIPTLKGAVKYTVPEGTQNGTEFRLRGKGVPQVRSSFTGDLIVRVRVEVPTRLTEKQKELLRQFDESSTGKEYKERKTFLDKMKGLFN
jgi:molecular chaperone DnaJ